MIPLAFFFEILSHDDHVIPVSLSMSHDDHVIPHLSKGSLPQHVLVGDVGSGDLEVLEAVLQGSEQGTHGGHEVGLGGLVKVIWGRGAWLWAG